MFVDLDKIISTSWRQLERWYRASLQDTELGIANLHINYAVNGLDTLRMLADDVIIMNVIGVNIVEFRNKLIAKQDEIQTKILIMCPNL